MGGAVRDATIILARWMEISTELMMSIHTSIYPIGSLRFGLSRHRALLFKVLADKAGIPCRLVKGSPYSGVEDVAVNIIKLNNESEFLVDLMAAPGTLIPADMFGSKDSSMKSYMPKTSKFPGVQSNKDLVLSSKPVSDNINSTSSQNIEPLISMTSAIDNGKRVLPSSQLDHIPSSAIDSSLYKGGRGPNAVGGGSRTNVNVVPYTQNNTEDNKNIFTELNPLQIKGSGKAFVQNNSAENKHEELQRAKNNQVSGRPPLPLMWKNRHAINEVPGKKEHEGSHHQRRSHMKSTGGSCPQQTSRRRTKSCRIKYQIGRKMSVPSA